MEHERKMQQETIAFQQKMEQERIEAQLATTLQQQSSQFQIKLMQQNQVFQAELLKKTFWKEQQLIIDSYLYVTFMHLYICIIIFSIIIIIVSRVKKLAAKWSHVGSSYLQLTAHVSDVA